jgi:hypothetical protein
VADWELLPDLVVPGLMGTCFRWMSDDRCSPWRASSATPGDGRGDSCSRSTSCLTSRSGRKRSGGGQSSVTGERRKTPRGNGRPGAKITGTPRGNGTKRKDIRRETALASDAHWQKVPSEKGGLTSEVFWLAIWLICWRGNYLKLAKFS